MKYLLLLIIAPVFLEGCEDCSGKQVTCPAFDDPSFTMWMPYNQNEELIFNSATAPNDTFKITDANVSDIFESSISANHPYCSAYASFSSRDSDSSSNSNFYIYYTLQQDQYTPSTEKSISIKIKTGDFYSGGFSDTGLIHSGYDIYLSHFYNTTTISNKIFNEVQEVFVDTTRRVFKLNEIYKLWIAKNKGIVGYEEFHGNLWVKQ